ncbi:MAG: hypothetical protein ACXQTR_01745 [Candidatus Methanospirareceae archaeon]
MVNYKTLQDQNGNMSSKRLAGAITLLTGLVGHGFLGVYSIFAQAVDPTTAVASFNTMMIIGGGLLGISVLEFLGKKKA